jgi:NAD(P)-dependent dehydrogenase (short-subunit alcohol dehydrogenase family)
MENGKTALVTGASRGIGRGIALRLAGDGYTVVINSRTADPSNRETGAYEVKRIIEEAGGKAFVFRADISSARERDELYTYVLNEIGRIDVLVNNAGIEPPLEDMLDISENHFDEVFSVNLKGPFFLTQAVARGMIERIKEGLLDNPKIVFITSVQAYMANEQGAGYSLTKAALHMAMTNFAVRLAREGITVFEIAPGIIDSDMSRVHKHNINKLIENGGLLTNRWGKPEDVAKLVSAIARGDLDYSTGSTIEVGGGIGVFRL